MTEMRIHEVEEPLPSRLQRLIELHGVIPEEGLRPERCRAIIFNAQGTSVLGIGRDRPGKEPYVVYPGGGLEEEDETPEAGVWRELDEELGLSPSDIELTQYVISLGEEYFYMGYATHDLPELSISGPEAQRPVSTSGTYKPGWYSVGSLMAARAFPEEISQLLDEA